MAQAPLNISLNLVPETTKIQADKPADKPVNKDVHDAHNNHDDDRSAAPPPVKSVFSKLAALSRPVTSNPKIGTLAGLTGLAGAALLNSSGLTPAAAVLAATSGTFVWHNILKEIDTLTAHNPATGKTYLEDRLCAAGLNKMMGEEKFGQLISVVTSDLFKQNAGLFLSLGVSRKIAATGLGGQAISSLTAGSIALYGVVNASDAFVGRLNELKDNNNLPTAVMGPMAAAATSAAEIASSGVAAAGGKTDMAVANISASNTSNALMIGVMSIFLGKRVAEGGSAKTLAWMSAGATFFKMAFITSIALTGGPMAALGTAGALMAVSNAGHIGRYLKNRALDDISGAAGYVTGKLPGVFASAVKKGFGSLFNRHSQPEQSSQGLDSADGQGASSRPASSENGFFDTRTGLNIKTLLGMGGALAALVLCADTMIENADMFGSAVGISDPVMAGMIGIGTNAPEAATAASFIKNGQIEEALAGTITSNTVNVLGAGGATAALSTDGLPAALASPFTSAENLREFALVAGAPAATTAAAAVTLSSGEKARLPGMATAGIGATALTASALYL